MVTVKPEYPKPDQIPCENSNRIFTVQSGEVANIWHAHVDWNPATSLDGCCRDDCAETTNVRSTVKKHVYIFVCFILQQVTFKSNLSQPFFFFFFTFLRLISSCSISFLQCCLRNQSSLLPFTTSLSHRYCLTFNSFTIPATASACCRIRINKLKQSYTF